jgi:TatD DNase family protein
MLFDTHCHLNSAEHYPDPDAAIRQANEAGVGLLNIVGTTPEDARRAIEIAEKHDNVFVIAGFHPNYCANYSTARLEELKPLLTHPNVVALGEIGLDYHWDYAPRELQFQALYDQLDLAREVGKPVVFHCREAYPDLLDVLESRPMQPYLIHCFAGDREDMRRALDLGCFFGVDGPVTYKKSAELREIVRLIGIDRLVLETDSPYLSPEPHRGKPNHPAYVRFVNDAVAAALEMDKNEVEERTTANGKSFFGIP